MIQTEVKKRFLVVTLVGFLVVIAFVTGFFVSWYRMVTSYAIVLRTTTLVETDAYLKVIESIDTKGPKKARSLLLSLSESNLMIIRLNQEQWDRLRWWETPATALMDFIPSSILDDTKNYNDEKERELRAKIQKLKSQ